MDCSYDCWICVKSPLETHKRFIYKSICVLCVLRSDWQSCYGLTASAGDSLCGEKRWLPTDLASMASSCVMSRDMLWWELTHNNRLFLSMENGLFWNIVKHTAAEWYVFSNNVCHVRCQCGVTVKQQWTIRVQMQSDFRGCNFSYDLYWSQSLFPIDLKYTFWREGTIGRKLRKPNIYR